MNTLIINTRMVLLPIRQSYPIAAGYVLGKYKRVQRIQFCVLIYISRYTSSA